jgi:hypothetical protein
MGLNPNETVSAGMPTENEPERLSAQEIEEQPLLQSDPVPAWSPPPGFLLIQIGKSNQSPYVAKQNLTI